MAGILLTKASTAILYNSVPWSHRLVSLKSASFPKGPTPAHLEGYVFKKGGDPATCARETTDKKGTARVLAMNACISRLRKK
jgi:hypothetical protein